MSYQASDAIVKEREWTDLRSSLISYRKARYESKFREALERTRSCTHADAIFLSDVMGNATNVAEARDKLQKHADDTEDPRSLCFAALLSKPCDEARLKKASDAGYAFAQVKLASLFWYHSKNNDKKEKAKERALGLALATRSANSGDSDGCDFVTYAYRNGHYCECDMAKMVYYLRWTCYMHNSLALRTMHECLEELDPERWFWLGQMAAAFRCRTWDTTVKTIITELCDNFEQRVWDCTRMPRVKLSGVVARKKFQNPKRAVFEIGRAFAMLPQLRKIERDEEENFAILFFRHQSNCCRAAIDQWCLIALRVNNQINKDIRKKVSLLVWASRNESKYVFDLETSNRVRRFKKIKK